MYLWGGRGGYIPRGLQTLTFSLLTVTRQCTGQLQEQLAVIQMNLIDCLLHLASDPRCWRDDLGNGCLVDRYGLASKNTWLLPACDVDSGNQGVTSRMEGPFVAGLSATVSCSTLGLE